MSSDALVLATKLTLVPAIIALISLAGRRWGARVAGRLSSFPVVAGPILFFVAIEHGNAFAAQASAGTVAAIAAFPAFALGYAWLATRFAWPVCLAGAYGVYGIAAALAGAASAPVELYAVLVATLLAVAVRLLPRALPPVDGHRAMRGELPLRMACGAALVYLITWLAASLGPRMSGVLAMFPVLGTVLTVFSHRASGAEFAVAMLRGMLWGHYSMMAFAATLAMLLPRATPAWAFAGALAAAVAMQALTHALLRRHP